MTSELRTDPLTGTQVVLSTERARRPHDVSDASASACPFCPARLRDALLTLDEEGRPCAATAPWSVAFLPNAYPSFHADAAPPPTARAPYHAEPAAGVQEVVVIAPDHDAQTALLSDRALAVALLACQQRMRAGRATYPSWLLLENHGAAAGASRAHPHWQLIGFDAPLRRIVEKQARCAQHHAQTGRCLVCDLVARERADGARLVFEDDELVAWVPYAARVAHEMLIAPRHHEASFDDASPARIAALAVALRRALRALGVVRPALSYNWALQTPPLPHDGRAAHWHVEVIPRGSIAAGFEWGTDAWMNALPPEPAAAALRAALERG